ncbi:hypothetical protein [Ancylobacter pratisalsi]|uniref:Uncharacterized protein n=1 Tax=Ancylobacter pratisalsi TaxID=1745854 RepID=A0A6P1YJ16_9HYPH|nr:hypothetical protein [Ancylobacter pratisalsi]QIB32661.1 hypothetical protein G3A50_02295 [Ancylobacter pratisalsi]
MAILFTALLLIANSVLALCAGPRPLAVAHAFASGALAMILFVLVTEI